MARSKINVQALHAALDAERDARTLSWRQLAKEIDVSPSLLSRLSNGYRPAADGFATLVRWLNMPAEEFMVSEESAESQQQPELVSQLAPLLRARQDLEPADITYLEEVIAATVRRVKAQRSDSR